MSGERVAPGDPSDAWHPHALRILPPGGLLQGPTTVGGRRVGACAERIPGATGPTAAFEGKDRHVPLYGLFANSELTHSENSPTVVKSHRGWWLDRRVESAPVAQAAATGRTPTSLAARISVGASPT